MSSYRRITAEDRFKIKAYLDVGVPKSAIAVKLGFHKSTVYRELQRNTGAKGYRHKQANLVSLKRQQWRKRPRKFDSRLKSVVRSLLNKKWSPEQISKRLEIESKLTISHESIYQYVYADYKSGGKLFTNLRFSHRARKPRFPRKNRDRRGQIKDALSIEKRSTGANNRSRVGHWERDTMFGLDRRNSVLLLADRKTRYIKLGKLPRRTASNTLTETKKLLKKLPCKSMTNDRGLEFSDHKQLAKALDIPVYFCHPYSSFERGTVENRIGILRQYLPKKTDLKYLKYKTLQLIEKELNNRPMKCLDWRTPYEVMFKKKVALTI